MYGVLSSGVQMHYQNWFLDANLGLLCWHGVQNTLVDRKSQLAKIWTSGMDQVHVILSEFN